MCLFFILRKWQDDIWEKCLNEKHNGSNVISKTLMHLFGCLRVSYFEEKNQIFNFNLMSEINPAKWPNNASCIVFLFDHTCRFLQNNYIILVYTDINQCWSLLNKFVRLLGSNIQLFNVLTYALFSLYLRYTYTLSFFKPGM